MKQDTNLVRSAADLERKYDLKSIQALKQNYELQKEGLNKVENELTDFVNVATESLKELQDQVDGNITTWFFNGVPSLENYPANEWVTNNDKNNHLGDLYYDQDTGYSYRFALTDGIYSWIKLTDSDITEALAIANAAKDTADTKRRVFVEQPTAPYDVGDLWLKDEELYRCQATIAEGESFKESDWIKATKYTDDTVANRVGDDLTVLSGSVLEIKNSVDEHTVQINQTTQLVNEQGEKVGTLEKNSSTMQQTVKEISSQITETNVVVKNLEKTIEYFASELEMYNLTIPSTIERYPLEDQRYSINHYSYYKGQQVTVIPTVKSLINGLNVSTSNTTIEIEVSKGSKIEALNNILELNFQYSDGDQENILTKKISISLSLQGQEGEQGVEGKSAYQMWLDAGNTGTEEEYFASLKGEDGYTPVKGTDYFDGEDGISAYFYVKYSANEDGSSMTTVPQSDTEYMGVASTSSPTAPISPSAYKWSKIKGKDGTNGTPGAPGENGKTSYLHIKYSNDGVNFTPNDGEDIGRWQGTYVDFEATDSTVFDDYKWVDTAIVVNEEINNLSNRIDETNNNIKDNYTPTDEMNQQIEAAKNTVITEFNTTITQTKSEWEASVINKINDNGVENLRNTLVTININGIQVATNLSKISTMITNDTFAIIDNTGSYLAYFGYDEESKKSKAEMDNLTIKNYLTAGYHRTEKFITKEGEKRTGHFWAGGVIDE